MNATTEVKMSLKKRAAIMVAAAGIMLSMGSGMALAANIQGGDRTDDVLIGTTGNDRMNGLGKDDQLRGLAGNDILRGEKGKDHLLGYGGNDELYGSIGSDQYSGGEGKDLIRSARDGGDVDRVKCGTGFDRATVDQYDVLADDSCEVVRVIESPNPPEVEEPAVDAPAEEA